ncbi:hypothetical protein MTR67_033550 [Solanum verrucosum]|uniref:Uncharacterized protein n=1 Tax=Solanum verrucosum TaxID=315347 RepID=A0AAF0U665_SOLVR|nr:hypothetical protein MTR67_033550 [Solanum verrucosum]
MGKLSLFWLVVPAVILIETALEKTRIKDGELVLTSTKTRKQENNFEDVLAKKQKVLGKFQEIINAASYAPLPPSDGLVKKISKLAVMRKENNFA